jgi:hypothetical protein
VPLALGQISVGVEMAVLNSVELVVLDAVEMVVLVGVGVVVLDGPWLVVEDLLSNQNKRLVISHFSVFPIKEFRKKQFITYSDFLLANQPPIPPPTPPPTMRITITHISQKDVARNPHILLVPDFSSLTTFEGGM